MLIIHYSSIIIKYLCYNITQYKCFNMLVNIQINKAWQKIIKTMI